MDQRSSRGRILEILLFSLSSMVLYFTGIGIFLFLVPLQVVASRRGLQGLLIAAGAFMVAYLGIRFWPLVSTGGAALPDVLTYVEFGVIAALMLGLVAINLPQQGKPRTLVRILAAAGITGIAAVPAGLLLGADAGFQASMNGLFTEVSSTLSGVFANAGDGVANSVMTSILQPARLRALSEAYLLPSVLVDYVALLSFSWWAGQAAAARALIMLGAPPRFRFSRFRLEAWWLWPLIGSAGLVLADLFFGLSRWAYAAWNIALVLMFLYGLQGMAILWFLFDKYRIPRFLWFLLIVGLAFLAASPGAGVFIVLAIPVLGISENWIRYRIPREAKPPEDD